MRCSSLVDWPVDPRDGAHYAGVKWRAMRGRCSATGSLPPLSAMRVAGGSSEGVCGPSCGSGDERGGRWDRLKEGPPLAAVEDHGGATGIEARIHQHRLARRRRSEDHRGASAPDKAHAIKAVCVLHNETATGCLSPIDQIRKAIDAAGHPALLLVDTISSLASTDYRHDEWGVDVTIGGAQKGLMLPPGMSSSTR